MSPSSRLAPLLLALLLAGAGPLVAGITPIALPANASAPTWEGPQFVQADQAGRVYFLRADTLEVYPVNKSGGFGKPLRLEGTALERGRVHRAVLSLSGDRWLLYEDFSVRLFVAGKEKSLPALLWNPWGVGLVRDEPVVAVVPRRLDRNEKEPAVLAKAPWLLSRAGDRWEELKGHDDADLAKALESGGLNQAIAEGAVLLQGDKEGKLWAARQYAYRVERFSAAGRPLLEIAVQGGKVAKKQDRQGISIKLHRDGENPTDATRSARSERGQFHAFTAKPVLLGLAPGPDGRLYLLVRQDDGTATLDRYDPTLVALQRLKLDFTPPNVLSLAAGKDALYLAAFEGTGGRWRLPWTTLEAESWQSVAGVEIDGVEQESDRHSGEGAKSKPPLR